VKSETTPHPPPPPPPRAEDRALHTVIFLARGGCFSREAAASNPKRRGMGGDWGWVVFLFYFPSLLFSRPGGLAGVVAGVWLGFLGGGWFGLYLKIVLS